MIKHSKFAVIHETVMRDGNLLCIDTMCEIAGVSRSGYYNWKDSAPIREKREEKDRSDFEIILTAYNYRGYPKGARAIYMRLIRTKYPMNLKKIRRLMNKYGLKCPVRRLNPYRQLARSTRTNSVFPNIVNREFFSTRPRATLLTDITYIFYGDNVCYLSTILDAFTREILAYELSVSLHVEFVLVTVDKLMAEYGSDLDDTVVVHSDQGFHYTSKAFIQKLRSENITQSMSRKGNCWDNAPQESFFGHMKDEIMYYVGQCESFDQVKEIVDDWMDYYNNERYQWDLVKLSPREYYEYVITGVYPLQKFQNFRDPRGSAPHPEV